MNQIRLSIVGIFALVYLQALAIPSQAADAALPAGDKPNKGARFVSKLMAGEKTSIVTLGTSLTGGEWRWVDVMMKDWLEKNYPGLVTLHNLGQGASASSHPPDRSGLDMVTKAAGLKPDVVFIEFGTNDAYLPYKISQADSKKNLNTMIDAVLAANPTAEIILQTMNSVKDSPRWGAHATSRPEVAAYFQGYRDVAKERGLLLVDNYPNWLKLMTDNPDEFDRLVPDRIHPQAEGYRRILLPQLKAALMPQASPGASASELWNQDWLFAREGAGPEATDATWETVSLPHTARIEKLDGYFYQGLCAYHKHFLASADWRGKKVQVRFDGAMHVAEVWLNGKLLTVHKGGYLPFIVNLTDGLNWHGDNVLALRLDNRDAPTVPPGKPGLGNGFLYFSGLYRNAHLIVTDPLHISDVFEANEVAGGGIFIRTESANDQEAVIVAQADIRNDGKTDEKASVRFTIDGEAVTAPVTIAAGNHVAVMARLKVSRPKLWSPDSPVLYTLRTELQREGRTLETNETRLGIRTLAYDDKLGFVLNGQPLRLRGANRHQDFPWLGNAVADNAQYRDIQRLKDAGFNFLRLAHYPQSESVMDACDELGLMNEPCTPGWQWWSDDPEFLALARQNIREMVRWHRNHPSAIMWEVSLNETYHHDEFHSECCRIAREEYPGGQLFTAGDSYASKDVRHYDVPYCGWPGNGYNRPAAPGFEGRRRSFIREYGDNDCSMSTRLGIGANTVEESENRQLVAAWAHQWTHNINNGWSWTIGDAIWTGVDHFCNPGTPILACGTFNMLRRPKIEFWFFQSQRPQQWPSIHIANYWTPRASPAKVVVYSNCDEVELQLNGRTLFRQKPDVGPDTRLGDPTPEDAMLTNYMKIGKTMEDFERMIAEREKQKNRIPIYTGGDCQHLDHAPFTFPLVPFESGELKAIGYIAGKKVSEFVRRTPGVAAALQLVAETLNRPLVADGADAIFVRAQIVDAKGELLPVAHYSVKFTVDGPARIISPNPASSFREGVASILLQAGTHPGNITITATADGLREGTMSLMCEGKAP